ncbi:hypothetical protein L218DRAFT_1004750 [Marasmius fiardii PR-910]|nr:hypothetical protein L218DRAFT_1004750 [Marasmius fiardii PR-910]
MLVFFAPNIHLYLRTTTETEIIMPKPKFSFKTLSFSQYQDEFQTFQSFMPHIDAALNRTFDSIPFQWHDLDGLSWAGDPRLSETSTSSTSTSVNGTDPPAEPTAVTGRDPHHPPPPVPPPSFQTQKSHRPPLSRQPSCLSIETLNARSDINFIPFPSASDEDPFKFDKEPEPSEKVDDDDRTPMSSPRLSAVGDEQEFKWEDTTADIEALPPPDYDFKGLTDGEVLQLLESVHNVVQLNGEKRRREATVSKLTEEFEENSLGF